MGATKAKQIIEAQDRGKAGVPLHVTFTNQYMFLPVPAGEILQDPALGQDPVSYY